MVIFQSLEHLLDLQALYLRSREGENALAINEAYTFRMLLCNGIRLNNDRLWGGRLTGLCTLYTYLNLLEGCHQFTQHNTPEASWPGHLYRFRRCWRTAWTA